MEEDFEFSEVWDEYRWEKFLQKQDAMLDKYFKLMDKFLDHPDRDRIVAKEMGWDAGETDEEFLGCESLLADDARPEDAPEDTSQDLAADDGNGLDWFGRRLAPLYSETQDWSLWIHLWAKSNWQNSPDPDALKMLGSSTVCHAKIVAALGDGFGHDDYREPGMVIAYLKRGLKAAHEAFDAANSLLAEGKIAKEDFLLVRSKFFSIREKIVDAMREYRGE